MTEIDLVQAYFASVNLSYMSSQWWIAASTALVVATYFAAKHIPHWLFGMLIALYLTTSLSALWETTVYSSMAEQFWRRLEELRAARHVPQFVPFGAPLAFLNSYSNYSVIILGTLSAIAYAFVTWRGARAVETNSRDLVQPTIVP